MTHDASNDDSLIHNALTASQYTSDNDAELEKIAEEACGVSVSESLYCTSSEEEKLRKKLQFFFMNPIQKWQAKRRFPYKFIIQIIKIVLVTFQLCLFAQDRFVHVTYIWNTRVSFSHLFLLGWDATREVNEYPPGSGPMALYRASEFFSTIDYAFEGYGKLNEAIGPYTYTMEDNSMEPMKLCFLRYKLGTIFGFNESYSFNSETEKECVALDFTGNSSSSFSSKDFLESKGIVVQFSSLIEASLTFGVKTVNFQSAGPISRPDCYYFNITIFFDNTNPDGQMKYSLTTESLRLRCRGDTEYKSNGHLDAVIHSVFNSFVIVICVISFILCSRAVYRANILMKETSAFFCKAYGRDISFEGKLEFINFWYIMIIMNDILIVLGSSMKQQIQTEQLYMDEWNVCSLLLGTGNLLVWFGVLRYLGFFQTYNVVILTLKKAAPNLLRFLLCAILIYSGFTFCGWLVLSPYHMKFRSLSSTLECLFSLVNGDDVFATFATFDVENPLLWWFFRVYLYAFISLFIYVILSLFTSVIIDAYETIKLYYTEGFPKNDIQEFVSECDANISSVPLLSESSSSLEDIFMKNRKFVFNNAFRNMCCGCCSGNDEHKNAVIT